MANAIANIFGGLVTVAAITTIVAHPESANVIRSIGEAYSRMLLAAQGERS